MCLFRDLILVDKCAVGLWRKLLLVIRVFFSTSHKCNVVIQKSTSHEYEKTSYRAHQRPNLAFGHSVN